MMANLQLRSLQYATGPSSPRFFKYVQQPQSPDEQEMCTHQIIRQNDFASFNILGLAIIFVVGGLIIILNLSLNTIVNKIQQGTPKGQYRIKEWDINGTLNVNGWHSNTMAPTLKQLLEKTFVESFENKLPQTADAPEAAMPATPTFTCLLPPKSNHGSFAEIQDLENESPGSVTGATLASENVIKYSDNDPCKGQLFDQHRDSKLIR